ncbi:MAG: NAD-dependent protein deacylase [Clostridia bacterium]|nr:NAD-dependent protein deacylase [Clostridia bacterium]
MEEKIRILKQMIDESKNIVFFGGAGVSTESGIPDFRSKDGLYNQKYKYPPEEILSHDFFMNNTEEFFRFYKEKLNCLDYKPNITHEKLAELGRKGKLSAIITQNIDGLHQKAGSKVVYEVHGSIMKNNCMKCGKSYDAQYVFNSSGVPRCECSGIIKPKVVLYGEPLEKGIENIACYSIFEADMLIVAGTSLSVYPAASFVKYYRGNKLVIINKDATDYDSFANLVINAPLGEVFSKI